MKNSKMVSRNLSCAKRRKIAGNIPFSRYLACLAGKTLHSVFFIFLLLTSCARLQPALEKGAPEAKPALEIAAQYCFSTGNRTGYNTFEVYLQNTGTNPIVFKSASLNNMDLPLPKSEPPTAADRAFSSISLDGTNLKLEAPPSPAKEYVTWHQFYPSEELPPNGTIVFQVNFKAVPTSLQSLRLNYSPSCNASQRDADSSIESVDISVPRFRAPEKLITTLTYPLDYSRVFVQYQSDKALPEKIWINNREITGFTRLNSPEPRTPDMLAFAAPFKIATGTPLHVKILFDDGESRHALVRALNGITLDADRSLGTPTDEVCLELGLDIDPAVLWIPDDVTCADVKSGEKGGSAPAAIAERLKYYRESPDKVSAIGYCTGMYLELWNIYGPLADAVFAKPYRLGYGHNPARFIEEEEERIEDAASTARPRPFLWIPESYKARGRLLEAEELEVLAWMVLAKGGKGIRYHYWKHPESGFSDCALLQEGIKNVNRQVRENRELLSPVALVSEHKLNDNPTGGNQKGWIKVDTAWSGDQGLLIMVRNLDYQTDAEPDNMGKDPRFHVMPKSGLTVSIALPEWLRYGNAKDLFTGKRLQTVKKGNNLDLEIDQLDAFKLLWLENRKKSWLKFWTWF